MFIFNIDFIIFTIWGYPVSLLELLGTLSGLACVYLTAKEKVICWPVGIINIICFFTMFYQVRLYSDMLLQVYFLVMSVYGWWKWTHPANSAETDIKDELKISDLSRRNLILVLSLSAAGVIILGSVVRDIHRYLPTIFPEAAAFPYPDAFTTVCSIVATVLMARKKRECWLLWIAVDIAATVVYFLKGINLVAIEYIVFGIIAANGYITWTRLQRRYSLSGA